jgi:hypothetical protein
MSDDNSRDETQPVRPTGAAPDSAPDPAPDPAPAPATRRGFRERFRTWRGSRDGGRTFGLAALLASALAGVIVGGLGFAAVDAVAGDDHGPGRDGWVQRDDHRGPGGRGGMHGGPRGVPGQLPPTTAPEDDGSSS